MEFKKSNRDNRDRSRLTIPKRDGSTPVSAGKPVSPHKSTPAAPYTPPKKEPELTPLSKLLRHPKSVATLRFSSKKIIAASIATVVLISIASAGSLIYQHSAAEKSKEAANRLLENLEYQTVLPDGKTISQLGGWKRVSPEKSDPVFAYTDTVDGVPVSVSQQPLPESFTGNAADKTAELAKKFNATNKLTAGDTTIYLGTSAKGPQSAVLVKNNLLILIKSQTKITDKSWTSYVQSLK